MPQLLHLLRPVLLLLLLAGVGVMAGSWLLPEQWYGLLLGSSDAWTLGQVVRTRLLGNYRLAASIGLIPNPAFDPLYPWLVARSPWLDPIEGARALSSMAWMMMAWPLYHLGRLGGGRTGGILALSGMFFPPLLATAVWCRYDALALCLTLAAVANAAESLTCPRIAHPLLAGFLLALAYGTRELHGMVALSVLLGLLLCRQGGRLAGGIGLVAGGLIGLSLLGNLTHIAPASGLAALLGYGTTRRALAPGEIGQGLDLQHWQDSLSLALVSPILAKVAIVSAGLVGLALLFRETRRVAGLVGLCLLLMPAFATSRQQSPQYYLIFWPLLALGPAWMLGRLLGRLPPRLGPLLALTGVVLLLMKARQELPALLSGDSRQARSFHTEAWPVPATDVAELCRQVQKVAGSGPVVLLSKTIENLDQACLTYLARPMAFTYPEHVHQVPLLASLYVGYDITVVVVESRFNPTPAISLPQALELSSLEVGSIFARVFQLPSHLLEVREDIDLEEPWMTPGFPESRGVHLQAWWLLGGWRTATLALTRAKQSRGGEVPVGGEWQWGEVKTLLQKSWEVRRKVKGGSE